MSGITFYRYKVEFYDEIDEKIAHEKGITAGENWKSAFENIIKYYGESYVQNVWIDALNDSAVLDDDILSSWMIGL